MRVNSTAETNTSPLMTTVTIWDFPQERAVRLEWLTLHDTLSLSVLGMMTFTTEEWLLAPKAAYRMTDNLTASLGGETWRAPRERCSV